MELDRGEIYALLISVVLVFFAAEIIRVVFDKKWKKKAKTSTSVLLFEQSEN